MTLDLFSLQVPEDAVHPNVRNILLAAREAERRVLQQWADQLPDRDGKFVKEFQTTCNSSFWELYLHALFREFGFTFDWSQAAPDFHLKHGDQSILVEATTANAAQGKPSEWGTTPTLEAVKRIDIPALNREAIIRLSNSILSKLRKYRSSYRELPHVAKRPFVLAVAPFEQPFFSLQYNRAITALLYDYYVDEQAALDDPAAFPDGPPVRHLGSVAKDNGSEISLGFFTDDSCAEISAIVFSCTATWGKVDALATDSDVQKEFNTVWGSAPHGTPVRRSGGVGEYTEALEDGLQVYHNPFARYPLDHALFRRPGVVQVFGDPETLQLVMEGEETCLRYRQVICLFDHDQLSESEAAAMAGNHGDAEPGLP